MPSFGVLPLVAGTLLVAFIAGIIALALGLCTAIFLSEYAPEKLRKILKPVLEILAGIPTVVYGYFALTVIEQQSPSYDKDILLMDVGEGQPARF